MGLLTNINSIIFYQELVYLQERCTSLEGEIEQHINTEESYENEIASLTKSLTNLETQLRSCIEEKVKLIFVIER